MEVPKIVIREDKEEQKKAIRGYAIVFERSAPAPWLGEGWVEKISRDAYEDVSKENTMVLFNHNRSMPIGKNGINARVERDETGQFVEIDLPNTTVGNDLYELVRDGIISGMSFASKPTKWNLDEENKVMTWEKFENLQEVSFVTFPFYEQTTAIVKEMQPIKDELITKQKELEKDADEIEKILKEMS